MRAILLFFSFAAALALAHAATPFAPIVSMVRGSHHCSNPIKRQEWRYLTRKQQKKYIAAVQCLLKKKSITKPAVPGAVNRYDDFSGVHIRQTNDIHGVGQFLPWHRMFVAVYEQTLRVECGYDGAQPYWDWTLDSAPGNFIKSPIFADSAFGGNGDYIPIAPDDPAAFFEMPGRTGGGCVNNGQFKDMIVNLGPGDNTTGNPRCLARDLSPYLGSLMTPKEVKTILSQPDYGWMDYYLEGLAFFSTFNGTTFDWTKMGVHGAGHFSIGGSLGTMNNQFSSSGDPTFYLHHANIDRVWWLWQKKDLKKRLKDISGSTVANFFGPTNVTYPNATLSFPIQFNELTAPYNFSIKDVMDIKGGFLCYDYI